MSHGRSASDGTNEANSNAILVTRKPAAATPAHRNAEARVEMRLRRRMTAIIDAYTNTRAPTVATWNKDWAGRFEPPMDTNIVGDSNDTYPNTKYSA